MSEKLERDVKLNQKKKKKKKKKKVQEKLLQSPWRCLRCSNVKVCG